MRYRDEKGFTLIELLAVIMLLGLLMTIGIVSITGYIQDSRLKTYLATAKEYISIASTQLAKQEIIARDTNTVYYIHINNLKNEKGLQSSPFGNWIDAYVVVVIDPDTGDFQYYWTSVDEAGYRIDVTAQGDLTKNSIYVSSDKTISSFEPIGGRDYVIVYTAEGNKESTEPEVELKTEEAESCFTYEIEEEGIVLTDYNKSCGTDVVVPSSIDGVKVYRIGEGAFRNKGITNVTIYRGVVNIDYAAFQGNSIDTVKLAISVKTVSDYAFYNSKIKNLVMSEGIEIIGSYAFAGNNICTVSLPASLKTIGSYAFYNNCLTKINIPAGVSISGGTFSGNDIEDSSAFIYYKNSDGSADYSRIVGYAGNNVNNLVIPSTKNGVDLKRIESNAFASVGLTGSITIPSTVTYIGVDAFAFNKLTSVVLPEGLKTISTGAFRSNYLTDIDIPNSVTSIGNYPFNTNNITGENAIIYARNSSGIDYSTIVGYSGGRTSGMVTIPAEKNGVKLKLIKANSFADSNLTAIYLPALADTNSLTIENSAFVRNKVPASFTSDYGDGGFFYKVTNGSIDYSNLSSYAGIQSGVSGTITIPETYNGVSLKTISANFTWMSYTKIVIPSTVTTINSSVLAKSARNNTKFTTIVNKTGREFDWKSITTSTYASTFVTGTIKHSAGNITVVSE